MPTQALQSQYWPGDGVGPEAPTSTPGTIYPWYFDGTTIGMWVWGLKLASPRERFWWEFYVKRYAIRPWRLLKRRLPDRLVVLGVLFRVLFSDIFTKAAKAVRETAKDPTSRNLKYWGEIGREFTRNPKIEENVWRGLNTTRVLTQQTPEFTRAERELAIELAVAAFKFKGR